MPKVKRRAGRPRTADAPRTPSGQLSRVGPKEDVRAPVVAMRALRAGLTVTEAVRAQLLDPLSQTSVGRLLMAERAKRGDGISAEQHAAAIRAVAVVRAFHAHVGVSPHPKSGMLEVMPESGVPPAGEAPRLSVETDDERARRVEAAYVGLKAAIWRAGPDAKTEHERVVMEDLPCRDLTALRRALDSVRKEFGLE